MIKIFAVAAIWTGMTVMNAFCNDAPDSFGKDGDSRQTDAAAFGFSPEAGGKENTAALQRAVDKAGTVVVRRPGTYKIAGTVFVGGNTSLVFGENVFLKKVTDQGTFCHVLLNKGALTRTTDENISVEGLQILVNGVDERKYLVYGLHGQAAFFHVKNLRIKRFRCLDLGKAQYGIHVCSFENILVDDVVIKGEKDGVHLGRGKGFVIRNGVFQTFDDAVALNAHDYSVGNPELGWIEDGVVENCRDLNAPNTVGFFCRILAGAWVDWRPGMDVQQSDTVVSGGRLYRVQAKPDGHVFKSLTRPTHTSGTVTLDHIPWGVVQEDVTYTAGVRNVVFRNIVLEKPRVAFSIHFYNDKYSRSYYPGARIPLQQNLVFENIQVKYGQKMNFLSISTPVDALTLRNCVFRQNPIEFSGNKAMPDYLSTELNLTGCSYSYPGAMNVLVNSVPKKVITFKTTGTVIASPKFSATVSAGPGVVHVESDIKGLMK